MFKYTKLLAHLPESSDRAVDVTLASASAFASTSGFRCFGHVILNDWQSAVRQAFLYPDLSFL